MRIECLSVHPERQPAHRLVLERVGSFNVAPVGHRSLTPREPTQERAAPTSIAPHALHLRFACDAEAATEEQTNDTKQQAQQETILAEGTAQVGMPAIKNFRERKLLKDILELRDQDGLVTYTYTFAENTGLRTFLCQSIGFGIPYATQFTNPSKLVHVYSGGYYQVLPQADPNGLFSPAAAEGTWVMCKDPHGPNVRPMSAFRLE